MPKLPRIDAKEAEKRLIKKGFTHIRTKGSHRIYQKETAKIVIPFHYGKILHPKIVKQVIKLTDE